ncbi:5'-nucleotidase, lipoprotein e(P4) family [Silanimonas sp.]|jgi:acid phosphatase|uniref:5'-nucleotidase, lipoprotein e(P4) family n=1 Tax=Silanimonas sp. TaxID=1929290 RepID=UPI0037CB0843
MTILHRAALALAFSVALAGCQTVAEAPAATPMPKPAASEPAVPAHDNLNATAWVQSSIEARMAHRQAWRSAERLLDAALADASWDALAANDRVAPVAGLPPAIIVDVDETVLDNSPYQVRLIREDGSFDDATWNAWVDEARATAVAGAPEFAQAAAKRGVTMIYLTNREHAKSAVTRRNLEAVGFPPPAESQFLGLGFDTPGCVPKGSDKGCRRQFVAQRYRVLMQFGDQLGDFVSVSDNGLEARATQLQGFDAWVGQRWFMLANPSYGSWESALYGNDRSLSRDAQRAAKRAALRD